MDLPDASGGSRRELSRRVQELKPSAPLLISQRAAELREAGRDVVSLGAGEPDFDTPDSAREAGRLAIDRGETHYTAVAGTHQLREAITHRLKRTTGHDFDASQVLVSNGAKQSIFNAILALVNPGETVLIPSPYWVSYPAAAGICGARSSVLKTCPENSFKIQPEDLERALTADVRLFVFNSPSNPTGVVYEREEIRELGAMLARSDTWILTDEIYGDLVYGDARHHSLIDVCPDLKDRTVVVDGFSKAYAMTGWRVGYAAGPGPAIAAMSRVQAHSTSNPCSISQAAALGALGGDLADLEEMLRRFTQRRQLVLDALREIDGLTVPEPGGAFYAFPDVSAYYNDDTSGSVALCEQVLEEAGVALVPGEAFGEDRCIRISFAAADDALEEALRRLRRFFADRPLGTSTQHPGTSTQHPGTST